jgi:hypothetical protein
MARISGHDPLPTSADPVPYPHQLMGKRLMEWTIQDFGAVGEFVGGMVVIVTVFYLALQLRT